MPGNYFASKLNEKWVKCFADIVNKGFNSIYHSDEDLRFLTNDAYGDANYICPRTFENWKRGNNNDPLATQVLQIYKKALIQQREQLFKQLQEDERAWQRYAWIIERKFSAWNLKNINENKNENIEKTDLTGASEETLRKLADEIRNSQK